MKKIKFNPENWVRDEADLYIYANGDFKLWGTKYRIIQLEHDVVQPEPDDPLHLRYPFVMEWYAVYPFNQDGTLDDYEICNGYRMYWDGKEGENMNFFFSIGKWQEYERESEDKILAAAKVVANVA
jgi:hypothetical protein